MPAQSTARPSRTVAQHLASRSNLRERTVEVPQDLKAKWAERKQELPKLATPTNASSVLLGR